MSRSLPLVVVIPGIGGSELADSSGKRVYGASVSCVVARLCEPSVLDRNNELTPVGLVGPLACCKTAGNRL